MPVRTVHLVAKTHLDLGFTALAAEVERQYLEEFFPRALHTAAELRDRGGSERFTWTTGSWILQRALLDEDRVRAAAVAAGVAAGDLAWHALPVTTHTELMDVALVRHGLSVSQGLDARFGRRTTAAKMTDVPGHTRGLVPLLAEAGVTFLHIGVNPAWPVPDVPPVFRWRSPDGAEVTVAYQAGGYGGEVAIDGCDHALAFLHAGDNLGPPTATEVLVAHLALRSSYPGAEVRASTLDAFARALATSGTVGSLPVVTAEIGDPWIYGAASDPQKVSAYREVLASPDRSATSDERLLLVAEHTWGLDHKLALPEDRRWDPAGLAVVRAGDAGIRFEASWHEQRAYVDEAIERLDAPGGSLVARVADRDVLTGEPVLGVDASPIDGFVPLPPDGRLPAHDDDVHGWSIGIDPGTGALRHLVHQPTGRVLADDDHLLGLVAHQSFDEADYDRFYDQLSPKEADGWWARWDNTKPGIDACGARSVRILPSVLGAWSARRDDGHVVELLIRLGFDADTVAHGAPGVVWSRWSFGGDDHGVDLALWWPDKPASRLPEATWCSFVPLVQEPERWELDKLGQRVSPLDVVRRGGRSLHGVGEGMHYDGPDGRLTIATPDAPLVAPGAPNLLDADPPLPDLAGGFHVLLHDNCWGTNFPMWNGGPAQFRFTLDLT